MIEWSEVRRLFAEAIAAEEYDDIDAWSLMRHVMEDGSTDYALVAQIFGAGGKAIRLTAEVLTHAKGGARYVIGVVVRKAATSAREGGA